LTASIAHEVNQPLAAIVANGNAAMRWLGHATPDLAEAMAALTRIVQDGLRAADVISAIRGMVRRGEPASQALDMGALVREVLGLLRTEIESNGVTLARDIAEDLPEVRGDRVQLQQVVLNLVMNAIEAMAGQPAGERRLRVDVTRSGIDHIAVGVSDTGPGIPPEVAARVFEPFYTTKNHGMGMGLSICRTIVEAHGGKLTLQPDSPHGTTFIVTLQTEGRLS
jgi:C4-dicarboxylate-specific signal transduction histidine kinase